MRRPGEAAVAIRDPRDHHDHVELGVVSQRLHVEVGDLGRPQVLVLDVDQPAGPPERLVVLPRDAALALRREGRRRRLRRIRPQHLHGARRRPAGDRGPATPMRLGTDRLAAQDPAHPVPRRPPFERRPVVPALPERERDVADGRAANLGLDVVPRRVRPVGGIHLLRLRIPPVVPVVAATVAQVDAADERDVELRPARVAKEHDLLMMGAGPPDPLVQQHLARRRRSHAPRGRRDAPRGSRSPSSAIARAGRGPRRRRRPVPRGGRRAGSRRP